MSPEGGGGGRGVVGRRQREAVGPAAGAGLQHDRGRRGVGHQGERGAGVDGVVRRELDGEDVAVLDGAGIVTKGGIRECPGARGPRRQHERDVPGGRPDGVQERAAPRPERHGAAERDGQGRARDGVYGRRRRAGRGSTRLPSRNTAEIEPRQLGHERGRGLGGGGGRPGPGGGGG